MVDTANSSKTIAGKNKPVALIILDGLGLADDNVGNAVSKAETPNLKKIWADYPHTELQASGRYVGLPDGVMGNSEVGHMTIGAGRILLQEVARIDQSIESKEFFDNEVFKNAISHVKKHNSKLHFIGLVSTGKVHSSLDHLNACLDFCKKEKVDKEKVFVHCFTDGRDTPPKTANLFLDLLERKLKSIKIGQIASLIGRYFAMDRDNRWERTREAYEMMTLGKGQQIENWKQALDDSYKVNISDQFLRAFVLTKDGKPVGIVEKNDAVIFFNYRADRAVQLSKAFIDDPFEGWKRDKIDNLFFAGFSNYEKGLPLSREKEDWVDPNAERKLVKELFKEELKKTKQGFPPNQIFPPERVLFPIGRVVAEVGLSQLRITESEKFPHLTYFMNGRIQEPFNREDRVEIDSPKDVANYDEKPQMSAYEVTDRLIKEIELKKYQFVTVNYALTDMVAHTGNMKASIQAVEHADVCLGKLVQAIMNVGGEAIITADHGNVEEMINLKSGEMDTQHSINPVPFIHVTNDQKEQKNLSQGMLADLAPTVLHILGIDIPDEMTGRSLI